MTRGRDERPLLLAYRALGLGDLLTAVPALRALARALPEHRRVLCAPAALAPLAALTGAVDEVVDTAPLAVPASELHGASVAVNLHGRGPQSHRALSAARPRRLIAFACADAGHPDGPAWHEHEHERERWCRLLEEEGIAGDPLDLDLPAPALAVPAGWHGATVVHPGASSAARRWPARRWSEVVRREHRAGRRVLVTGSAAELELACAVAAGAGLPSDAVLAGATDLLELAAVVAAAERLLCGDTGVAHLATALGTPSVLLFGPASPDVWGPPPERDRHIVLWAGGHGDPHADRPHPGLLALGVDDVLDALDALPLGLEAVG